jgi:IS4 transposase
MFERIEANGGYFLSRLKSNADPLILGVNAGSGLPEQVSGRHLSELLPELHRGLLDAVVEVSFRKRQYRGSRSAAAARFRLVCVWDDVRREYHSYITNLPVDRLDAVEVATLYRCRWEIELVFKELKSQYRLDQMPTANPHAVEALVWTALITMLVSRRLYLVVVDGKGIDAIRYTRLRWSKIFVERATRLFDFLLNYMDIEDGFDKALAFYESPALDPNVRRRRMMGDILAFP